MFLFIYIISFVVVFFTVTGIIAGHITEENYDASKASKRDAGAMIFVTLCPVINTIAALVIVVTMTWLLFFKPGSNPNPPA